MALGQIGPLTTMLEAAASAVGAGVVFCSVAAGIAGLARGRRGRDIEASATYGGYVGGGIGAAFALIDIVLRYGISK